MKRFSAVVMLLIVGASCGQMYRKPGDPDRQPEPATQLPVSPPIEQASSPTVEPAAAPMTAAPMTAGSAKTIAQRFVDAHDRVRAKHCAPPLTWSPKLAAVAQQWADSLRDQGCKFGHSGGKYGENLAAGTAGLLDPEATVKMWYDEIAKYKFPDGGFSAETGHFTQVVWRGTTQVGCGHSSCNGNDIWVCNYDPAGNWDGQYRENVLPLGCK